MVTERGAAAPLWQGGRLRHARRYPAAERSGVRRVDPITYEMGWSVLGDVLQALGFGGN